MKRRILTLVAVSAMLLTLTAVPVAQADPPGQFEDPIFSLFLDTDNWKASFWNMTRDSFCEWEASDFEGPPPVESLVPAQALESGKGAIVAKFKATRHFELWDIDDPDNPIGPCEDTAGQDGPLATGYVSLTGHDNDLFGTRTRGNVFGETGTGTLTDNDGASWHYSWHVRLQIDKNDEFRVVNEHYNLKKRGR